MQVGVRRPHEPEPTYGRAGCDAAWVSYIRDEISSHGRRREREEKEQGWAVTVMRGEIESECVRENWRDASVAWIIFVGRSEHVLASPESPSVSRTGPW